MDSRLGMQLIVTKGSHKQNTLSDGRLMQMRSLSCTLSIINDHES